MGPGPARDPARPPPLLATEGLSLSIGGAAIVEEVSLSVAEGELVALIGPNGAGKSSLLNLVSGLLRPTRGQVWLGGNDITARAPHQRARAGLGRTFQTSSLFPALGVHENVRLAAEAGLGGALRIWRPAARVTGAGAEADRTLDLVGLAHRRRVAAGSLSHGEKRQLELAVVLAGRPRVVLLDEPLAGMSVEEVPRLVGVIGSIPASTGAAVLMVEHHLEVVLDLAERVAVMHHGELLAEGTPDQVISDPAVQDAYLGAATL
ncbi:MAG: ABC transporter ATP-binding protein [Acidimicrobiales bacterium]